MSILSSLSTKLLSGKPYGAFKEVTNGDSMMAVLSVDVMDNFGRGYMAYRRDGIGKEFFERNFEVWTASIVWGFGATVVRDWVDKQATNLQKVNPVVKKFFNLFGIKNIKSGTLNPDVFGKKHPQHLTLEKINSYEALQIKQLEESLSGKILKQAKAELAEVMSHQRGFFDKATSQLNKTAKGLYKQYGRKEGLKLGLAFALPSALIGFIIPRIYQKVTRRSIQKEKNAKYVALSKQLTYHPILFKGLSQTEQPFGEQLKLSHVTTNSSGLSRATFGRLGSMFEHAVQRVRESPAMNTLMIDGVISGGRTYMARNIYERLEVMAQELGLIFFAFFGRTQIQHYFENVLDRAHKTLGKFPLPSVKWLTNLTQGEGGMTQFQTLLSQFKVTHMPSGDDNAVKGIDFTQKISSFWNKKEAKANAEALKAYFIRSGQVQKYMNSPANKAKNILFEIAKENGDIGTWHVGDHVDWGQSKKINLEALQAFADSRGLTIEALKNKLDKKPLKDLSKSDIQWLKKSNIHIKTVELFDATQEISAKGLHEAGKKLTETIKLIEKHFGDIPIDKLSSEQLKKLQGLLKKSAGTKFIAWLGSILISTAFVGWIIPRSKQLITSSMTGKDVFPGAFNNGERQNMLSVNHTQKFA